MEFLYPTFLWALAAILIPIIIHLFYFKRFKKVYFSNTKFLKEIKEETTNKNKLKNILVLLSRILAIAFLVFAFAQPYIPVGEKIKKGTVGVSIFIDNSFSMQTMSEDAPLIDKAKLKATQVVNGFPDNTRYQILTNKLYGSEQKWIDKQNALEKINEIKLSPAVKKIKNILKRQKQSLENNEIDNKYIYWISDLQRPIFDIDTGDIDTIIDYNIIALQPVREKNISIDSCYWQNPVPVLNQVNKLIVKIGNHSNENLSDIPVNIEYNNQNYPSGKIDIKANSSKTDTLELRIKTNGWNTAKINIKDYPVVFDDDYYIAFDVPDKIQVLNINNHNRANTYLKAVFETNKIFQFKHENINKIDYSGLDKNRLIVLEDIPNISSGLKNSLKEAVSKGVNVLIFPSKDADLDSYNSFLSSINANILDKYKKEENEANNLNRNEFVFTDVYEKITRNINPIRVKANFPIKKFQSRNSYHVIKFKNGESFIDRFNFKKGNVYLCSSPFSIDINDLAKNPDIFIPMIFKMAIYNSNKERLAYSIGKDKSIEINDIKSSDKGLIKIVGNQTEFIPKQLNTDSGLKIFVSDEITKSGIYNVEINNNIIRKIAFNYDRTESDLNYVSDKEIKKDFKEKINYFGKDSDNINFTELIDSKQRGVELWKWAIILALLFLAIEILLLRFWKNK